MTSPGGMLSDAFPAGVQAAIRVDRQAKITQFGVNITPEFDAMHPHSIPISMEPIARRRSPMSTTTHSSMDALSAGAFELLESHDPAVASILSDEADRQRTTARVDRL